MIGGSAMRPLVVQKWTIDSSKTETSFLLLISTLRKTAILEKPLWNMVKPLWNIVKP
jgi:hypothetical protein